MAKKTFISYKYSEATNLRDRIIDALGDDANYYKGETSESPDLTDHTTENIKEGLKNMIYGTSVTIVILSPDLKDSEWIDWEISYSLKEIKRGDKTSKSNGILAVAMKDNGSYDWLISSQINSDNCTTRTIDDSKLYPIINSNRYNLVKAPYSCETCKSYDQLNGSYIAIIKEDDFIADPTKYIENAYDKSHSAGDYKISKQA